MVTKEITKIAVSDAQGFCEMAKAVIETEIRAVKELLPRIDHNFVRACELLLGCQGRIVVTGMGKSGHIGHKIAATLASTGSPAFFVHSGEATHGDLGMITRRDVMLAISNSGNTHELLTIIPLIKRFGIPLISLTGSPRSVLARASTVTIDISISEEACPLGLAPTSSTTAALVMGDALAIALLQARGFTREDFALTHPAGTLGRRLLLHIDDLMHTGKDAPCVTPESTIAETLIEITNKRLGMAVILNPDQTIAGIYTDGDLRRTLDKGLDIHKTPVGTVMTRNCKTISLGTLAAEALHFMEQYKITSLIVADDQSKLLGVVHMHDMLSAGVV